MPKWIERFGSLCVQQGIIQKDQLPWFIYGLEKRISSFLVAIPFFLLSLFLTSLECTLSFFMTFFLLRRKTNGYHAKSLVACLYISLLLEIFLLNVIYILLPEHFILFLAIIGMLFICKLAPYNHPNMNYTQAEISACRLTSRIYACALTFLAILASTVGLYELSKGFLLGITMTAVLLCMAYISEWRKRNE